MYDVLKDLIKLSYLKKKEKILIIDFLLTSPEWVKYCLSLMLDFQYGLLLF